MSLSDSILYNRFVGKGFVQMRIDYDANNNPIYIGFAVKGALSSAAAWVISKNTYDANNNLTVSQSSSQFQIWDNRTSLTYS